MEARATVEKSLARDIVVSALIHAAIAMAILTAPMVVMQSDPPFLGEVIRVSLSAPGELPQAAAPIPSAPTPVAMAEPELVDIPMDKPSAVEEFVPIEKKESEPAKEPEQEPQPTPEPRQSQPAVTENSAGGAGNTGETEVDSTLTGGAGSPFGDVTVDNASFNYPYWFTQAFTKIRRNMQNPVLYDGKLICVVYFQVIKSGRVIKLEVESPSGIDAFDNACKAAVERSKPFPPLPKDFRDEIIGIRIPFTNN